MQRFLIAAGVVAVLAGLTATPTAPVSAQVNKNDWATVKGRIVWKNAPPREKIVVKVNKPDCLSRSADGKTILDEEIVVNPKNNGLANVVVFLLPKQDGGLIPLHPDLKAIKNKQVVMDQPCCMFEPRVVAVREGQELVVKNSAKILHNVRWLGEMGVNKSGNILLPPGQQKVIEGLKVQRGPLLVECNIHGWMKGRIVVFNHPYFAVTDENGKFEIPKAPQGEYRIKFLHEQGYRLGAKGKNGQPITIKGGKTLDLGDLPFR